MTQAHEAKCKKCSACCRKKVRIEGVVFWLPFWCRHLDRATRLCREYERRHEASPTCLAIPEALEAHALPTGCAYTSDTPGYRGPVEINFWGLPEQVQRSWAAKIGITPQEFDEARREAAQEQAGLTG